jgi:hypothetical protein
MKRRHANAQLCWAFQVVSGIFETVQKVYARQPETDNDLERR